MVSNNGEGVEEHTVIWSSSTASEGASSLRDAVEAEGDRQPVRDVSEFGRGQQHCYGDRVRTGGLDKSREAKEWGESMLRKREEPGPC